MTGNEADIARALVFVVAIGLIALYFLPVWIAIGRRAENKGLIAFVTLLVAWSGLGWLLCVIWAAVAPRERVIVRRLEVDAVCDSCGTMQRATIGEVFACPHCRTGFVRAPMPHHESREGGA